MARLEGREERLTWLAVAGLTVLALILRLHHFLEPLNGDEISTAYIVDGNSLGGVLSDLSSDKEISPPLYFLLAWASTKLGSAPELIRLPSLIAGVASIPLVFLVGRKAVSSAAGLLAAAVMTLMPFMIFYSADGRTYALAIALLLGSTLAMLHAAESGRTRTWVLYGVLTALAMYTHYTAAFVLAAQLAWLLLFHPEARKPALLANAGAVVLFLPWVPGMLSDFDSPTVDILSALQGDGFTVKRVAVENWAFGYPFNSPDQVPGHLAIVLIVAGTALATIAAAVRIWTRLRAGEGSWMGRLTDADRGLILVVALALATPLAELLILGVTGNDLFGARNLNTSSAGLALAVGAVLGLAGWRIAVPCAIAVLAGYSIGVARAREDRAGAIRFDSAAEFIEARAEPGDAVLDAISAAVSPVPLTPLQLELDDPPLERQFQLFYPTGDPPYLPYVSAHDPPGPIVQGAFVGPDHHVFLLVSRVDIEEGEPGQKPTANDFSTTSIKFRLPNGWEIVDQRTFDGVAPLTVYEFAPTAAAGGG